MSRAVEQVSLEIRAKEVITLVSESGSKPQPTSAKVNHAGMGGDTQQRPVTLRRCHLHRRLPTATATNSVP